MLPDRILTYRSVLHRFNNTPTEFPRRFARKPIFNKIIKFDVCGYACTYVRM
jgi:hypothetical protein